MERWQTAGFGLYVHWPFCLSKCPYCDFNSHVAGAIDQKEWAAAFSLELRRLYEEIGARRLSSIFFGGGTPSLMAPETVAHIIDAATGLWSPANDIEITLEANPTSVEMAKFRAFRDAGVNRVSIGVQSLRNADLRRLGRMHDADEARRAIHTAQSVFDRFSFDLIYARQDQGAMEWERELREAIEIGSDHLSLYQLTIESGTVFGERHARGLLNGLPEEDLGAEMYQLTQDICADAGLLAYEVSNHAREGQESRHNLIYWKSGDFGGIGPGAHGRLTVENARLATEGHRIPQDWLKSVQQTGTGDRDRYQLSMLEMAEEYLVMGLRLAEGIELQDLRAYSEYLISAKSLADMQDLGVITVSDGNVKATQTGRLLLNSVIEGLELVPSRGP